MNYFTKFFLIGAALTLTACGDAITYKSELEPEAQAAAVSASTPVDEITLTSANTVNQGKFTVVGPVKANVGKATAFHANPTVEQAEQKLRIEAAELGADAVINVVISDVRVCALSWGCRAATGTAVSFD